MEGAEEGPSSGPDAEGYGGPVALRLVSARGLPEQWWLRQRAQQLRAALAQLVAQQPSVWHSPYECQKLAPHEPFCYFSSHATDARLHTMCSVSRKRK